MPHAVYGVGNCSGWCREPDLAVYVDEAIWVWKGRKWCHLMADEIEELHRFAFRLGLHLSSYQGPPKTRAPHYDITGLERDRAVRLGAIPVGRREIVSHYRRQRIARKDMPQNRVDMFPKLPAKRPG